MRDSGSGSGAASQGPSTPALLSAIEAEDIATIEEILAASSVNVDAWGDWQPSGAATKLVFAPVHLASRLALGTVLQLLLDAGASALDSDEQGWSCLHHLATSSAGGESKAHALQVLEAGGADADAITPELQIALHLAASEATTDAAFLSRIILATRETSARDSAGRTALHYVSLAPPPSAGSGAVVASDMERRISLVEALLRYASIDPRDVDSEGLTASDLAWSRGLADLASHLRQAEARAAAGGSCCGCGVGCCGVVQPAALVLFVLLSNAAAAFYCLPCLPPAWPSIAILALFAAVVTNGLATSLCDPGYLPKFPPPKRPEGTLAASSLSPAAPPGRQPLLTGVTSSTSATGIATREIASEIGSQGIGTREIASEIGPRALPPSSAPGAYCHSCRASKPLRSKHCRACDRCVAEFDHHCPWLGACVGRRNRVPFYLFVTTLVANLAGVGAVAIWAARVSADATAAIAAGKAIVRWLHDEVDPPVAFSLPPLPPPPPPSPPATWLCRTMPDWWCAASAWRADSGPGVRIALAVISLLVVVPLAYFWAHRTRNILTNMTTNERYNGRRYPHFRGPDGSFVNPFDHGPVDNCRTYFCACVDRRGGQTQVLVLDPLPLAVGQGRSAV